MSFRDKMHPQVSKLEIELLVKELRKRGLINRGFNTQLPICLKQTTPDFTWLTPRKIVFLDGDAVHEIGDEWDEEVVELLRLRHWNPIRIRYHAPASIDERIRVADEIQEFIG